MRILKWFLVIFFIFLIGFPFYWVIISSFKTPDQILQPDLWPKVWSIENYKQLLTRLNY